jgi:predicted nucleic acid-binding protein
MRWAIIDTSVYIDHWERGLHEEALRDVRRAFIIRQSSIVLSELRRGARTKEARGLVDALYRLARIQWAPTAADWWEAGLVIRQIGDAQRWDAHRRQAFQNDALIALTARRHGAAIVTTNRRDFDLLDKRIGVPLFAI